MTAALRKTIFVACRELGLDEDARRDLQLLVTGKDSITEMDDGELKAVVNALEKAGFKKSKGKRYPRAPRADLRLCHVLWSKLGHAGCLKAPGRAGLNAFVRKRFEKTWGGAAPADIDMLRDHAQINDVVQALKEWCAREDIEVEL